MSTREIAYSIFERLTDEQLKGFILLFRRYFDEIPNEETLEAFEEVEEMKKNPEKYKEYTDLDELFNDLNS